MNKYEDKIKVASRHVSCDGGGGELGHPKVYFEIKEGVEEVYCPYCSKHFILLPAERE
jgi:uncharacterized Zn-finger protein